MLGYKGFVHPAYLTQASGSCEQAGKGHTTSSVQTPATVTPYHNYASPTLRTTLAKLYCVLHRSNITVVD